MKKKPDSLIERLYAGRATRTGGGWPWLLHRITGLAIFILVFIHLWIKSFGNPGKIITFESSVERLHQPFWLVIAFLMVVVLLFHSFNGIKDILADYITRSGIRRTLFWSFLGAGIVAFFIYLIVLLPFIRS